MERRELLELSSFRWYCTRNVCSPESLNWSWNGQVQWPGELLCKVRKTAALGWIPDYKKSTIFIIVYNKHCNEHQRGSWVSCELTYKVQSLETWVRIMLLAFLGIANNSPYSVVSRRHHCCSSPCHMWLARQIWPPWHSWQGSCWLTSRKTHWPQHCRTRWVVFCRGWSLIARWHHGHCCWDLTQMSDDVHHSSTSLSWNVGQGNQHSCTWQCRNASTACALVELVERLGPVTQPVYLHVMIHKLWASAFVLQFGSSVIWSLVGQGEVVYSTHSPLDMDTSHQELW